MSIPRVRRFPRRPFTTPTERAVKAMTRHTVKDVPSFFAAYNKAALDDVLAEYRRGSQENPT